MGEIIDMHTKQRQFVHSVRLEVDGSEAGLYCDCGWESDIWVTGMTVPEIVAVEEDHQRAVAEAFPEEQGEVPPD